MQCVQLCLVILEEIYFKGFFVFGCLLWATANAVNLCTSLQPPSTFNAIFLVTADESEVPVPSFTKRCFLFILVKNKN